MLRMLPVERRDRDLRAFQPLHSIPHIRNLKGPHPRAVSIGVWLTCFVCLSLACRQGEAGPFPGRTTARMLQRRVLVRARVEGTLHAVFCTPSLLHRVVTACCAQASVGYIILKGRVNLLHSKAKDKAKQALGATSGADERHAQSTALATDSQPTLLGLRNAFDNTRTTPGAAAERPPPPTTQPEHSHPAKTVSVVGEADELRVLGEAALSQLGDEVVRWLTQHGSSMAHIVWPWAEQSCRAGRHRMRHAHGSTHRLPRGFARAHGRNTEREHQVSEAREFISNLAGRAFEEACCEDGGPLVPSGVRHYSAG